MEQKSVLYIVIPCYNEQEVLPISAPIFLRTLSDLIAKGKISPDSRLLFVDDGSQDGTWDVISALSGHSPHCMGISLSRNHGHQNAILAGLTEAADFCDIAISIDCDGQDDPCAIEAMVDAYHAGSQVVYGVRDRRDTDTPFKRVSARCFYRLLTLMGVEAVCDHADFRLVSKQVLDAFSDFHEVNLFLRGIFPLVGFNSSVVYYHRKERLAGKSRYSLPKMLLLAADGITSLSVRPLHLIALLGFLVALLSGVGIIWSLVQHFLGHTVSGWTSIVCIVCFLSGVQLLSLGVVGEYIGKIFMEVKHRPRYIISKRTQTPQDSKDAPNT